MNSRFLGIILLVLLPIGADAGDPEDDRRGQGYVFYGAGRAAGGGSVQQLGGGGDFFIYKGLAAGVELGYLYPPSGFTYGVGLFSANGSYHLYRGRKLSPFVTAGYSLAFRGGHENLYNFGGGVTWWFGKHAGVRMEVRDYVWPAGRTEHSPLAQVGITFR